MSEAVAKPYAGDPAAVFVVLAHYHGDVQQAAVALKVSEDELWPLINKHNWLPKLKAMGVASVKRDAVGRALNRGLNFIQATRCRELVDRLLVRLLSDDEVLAEFTTEVSKHGTKRTIRPLVDLVTAANVAQEMTARALQDTPDSAEIDREAMKDGKQISIAIADALDAASSSGLPGSKLMRDVIKEIEDEARTSA